MRYIIILLLIIGVGVYLYTTHHSPETDISFEVQADHVKAVCKDFEFIFSPQSAFQTEATIMQVSHENDCPFSVFCGSFGLVWGDTAIELASYWDKNIKDIFDQLSPDAQKIYTERGCGGTAQYLNEHTITMLPIAPNKEIDKALRALKRGDKVSLEGYNVTIISAQYQGHVQSLNIPHTVCITKAVINNETYGE